MSIGSPEPEQLLGLQPGPIKKDAPIPNNLQRRPRRSPESGPDKPEQFTYSATKSPDHRPIPPHGATRTI